MRPVKTSVLAIRPFRNLWLGQAVSQFGDALYGLILLFMAGKISGEAAAVGYVGAATALPYLLFSPSAGVAADRHDRRRLMLFADFASAAIMGALGGLILANPEPPIWVLAATGFLLSTVNAYFAPAKSAAIPGLVPTERLIEANSLSAATQSLMPMLGLGLSGTVLGVVYKLAPNAFFLTAVVANGLTFLASAAAISTLPPLRPERTDVAASAAREFREGLRFIWSKHVLKVAIVLGVLLNFVVAPFMVVTIEANQKWFGGAFSTLAAFEFGFMAAMVVGSLAVGRFQVSRPGVAFCTFLALVGLFVAAMAFSRNFWLYLLWNVVCGIALPFAQVPLGSCLQAIIPDGFRGRVNSVMTMAAMGVSPLAMALAGAMIDSIGLVAMFLAMGLGMAAIAIAGLFDRPFRSVEMPTLEPQAHPETAPAR